MLCLGCRRDSAGMRWLESYDCDIAHLPSWPTSANEQLEPGRFRRRLQLIVPERTRHVVAADTHRPMGFSNCRAVRWMAVM